MQQLVYLKEQEDKRTGYWVSLIFHLLLLLLFLIPCFNLLQEQPPEQQQGIIVAFGNPESEVKSNPKKSEKSVTSTKKASTPPPTPKKSNTKKAATKAVATKVVSETIDESSEIAASKKKAAEEKREAEAKAKAAAELEAAKEAERQRKEAEEKARQEEARERAEAKSKAKSKFSSLFGKGDEDAADSKGQTNGKPNASALDGLSTGSGKIGDGLGERGTLFIPKIVDDTQKTGRVVVRICVNADGNVMSAKYTQKGSTTTDAHLISVAEKNAKKYKFTKSKIVEQCGNIVIDFKLR